MVEIGRVLAANLFFCQRLMEGFELKTIRDARAAVAYRLAKQFVIERGFEREIEWQEKLSLQGLVETSFLREMAWVVLASGMRESVVRRKFPEFSRSFLDWESSSRIVASQSQCRQDALQVFNHQKKVDSIICTISEIHGSGFEKIRDEIKAQSLDRLRRFPFIGPVTCFHLAKNLGIDVVKPDRHLVRISGAAGYQSPDSLCRAISNEVGDKVSVVDIVLWRLCDLGSLLY